MTKISDQTFSSDLELEHTLVKAAVKGKLVLTSTARLSRRVLHCFRLERIEGREQGWKTPSVLGFNRWVRNAFESLWEPYRPLSRLAALRLWDEATQRVELVEGLRCGPFLYQQLQDSFDLLMRSGQPLVGPASGHILPDWRRAVFERFLTLFEENQYILWGNILRRVGEAVDEGRFRLPENIILAGYDEFSPMEQILIESMARRSKVGLYRASRNPDGNVKVRVYATPEQECQGVCAEVINSWNSGQKRLAVVLLDQDYLRLIKHFFEELVDRQEKPSDALRYNLTMGIPLSEHPLFQTALLPLRLLDEPRPNKQLSSLLFSPYIREFQEDQEMTIRDFLWGQAATKPLEEILFGLSHKGCPIQPLHNLSLYVKRPLKVWLQELENLWKNLGFPSCRCETDILAKEHLFKIADELENELGYLEMARGDVLAWINTLSRGIEVVEKTPETAGIQILNLVESQGLAFDQIWVVGTHGRALPQTVVDLPFLDPEELCKLEGGTPEKQWEAGQRNLSSLLAGAHAVTFSRAASKGEDSPYLPCPLIPDESSEEHSHYTIDLWKEPPEEWLRARWLREGLKGLWSTSENVEEKPSENVNFSLPDSLRVTQLESLLLCPFKFFAENLLALEPLEEPLVGIDPRERGDLIHRVLREFTRGLAAAAPDWPEDRSKALAFLEKTVDDILGDRLQDPFWQVERMRLLGSDEFPGLLKAWLDVEEKRALEGWRFEAAEEPFDGLLIAKTGISLSGRLDRVDTHPEKGRALWDYKTGNPPLRTEVVNEMVRPQLPAYLLAVQKGLVSCLVATGGQTQAGYILLKKASEVKVSDLKNVDWEDFLEDWIEEVEKRLEGPLKGIYKPDPRPRPSSLQNQGACEYCAFPNLCGYEEQREEDVGSEDKE
jgi:ATP-dependent helicase/nuclease subunit B